MSIIRWSSAEKHSVNPAHSTEPAVLVGGCALAKPEITGDAKG
jgi:hypothetical protein